MRAALDFIAPDGTAEQLESEARIEWRQQDADFLEAGLYAWCAEYPEEGCVLLDEEPATSQPSPAQAEQHWPKLEKPAKVGAIRFHAGLSSRLVVEAAQRLYEFESTPEKEAERIERLQAFREQLDPLNVAPHAEAFNEAPDEALRPEQAEAERPIVSFEKYMQVMYDRDENAKRLDVAQARVAELEMLLRKLSTNGLMQFSTVDEEMAVQAALGGAPVAQAQQLHDLDKQCRDDVARALGLRPNQERGFAWSYLLASIKSCVKASGDSAQAQHSVPEGWKLVPSKPTIEMVEAGYEESLGMPDRSGHTRVMEQYEAMLAAAPGKEGV
ncbi:TPA: hypothetical protein ACL1SF_000999 [Pseudomonas aeruginosa]